MSNEHTTPTPSTRDLPANHQHSHARDSRNPELNNLLTHKGTRRVVHKLEIQHPIQTGHYFTVVSMPIVAKILYAARQIDVHKISVWYETVLDASAQDSTTPKVNVLFEFFGTGDLIPDRDLEYLDTFLFQGCALVYHLYWKVIGPTCK